MKQPPRGPSRPLLDNRLLRRAFLWLGPIEAGLCYVGFIAVYLFSGNAAQLNQSILNSIHWPTLFTVSGDVDVMAKTVFFAGVVIVQIGNAFACRTFKAHNSQMGWISNRALLLGIGLSLVMIVGMVYIPFLARIFDNVVFPAIFWPVLGLFALILYSLEAVRKGILRWFERKKGVISIK